MAGVLDPPAATDAGPNLDEPRWHTPPCGVREAWERTHRVTDLSKHQDTAIQLTGEGGGRFNFGRTGNCRIRVFLC
jgi:hypothetical protein